MILKRTFVMLVALFGLTFSAVTLSGGDSYARTSDLQRGLTFAPDCTTSGASAKVRSRSAAHGR